MFLSLNMVARAEGCVEYWKLGFCVFCICRCKIMGGSWLRNTVKNHFLRGWDIPKASNVLTMQIWKRVFCGLMLISRALSRTLTLFQTWIGCCRWLEQLFSGGKPWFYPLQSTCPSSIVWFWDCSYAVVQVKVSLNSCNDHLPNPTEGCYLSWAMVAVYRNYSLW